ncbi:unnamed protein product [Mytilus edulis]|uniref:Uncharacterized protein n=1 Tax=Mytilus edulis TaxID=6550 RepID=A0A8S3T0S5_MYTED|nr:unnamed protein product [Mytilus edulis]
MESLAKFFNAAVVLPLTAGEASQNHHSTDNVRSHDGSISGLILLSSVLVITVLSMFGVQLVDSEKTEMMTYFTIYSYLCVVIFLAIVVCIAHLINYRLRDAEILTTAGNRNTNFKVKFLFLWIFAIGSSLFTLAKIISTVRCEEKTFEERKKEGCLDKNSTYDTSYEVVKVSFHCIEIIFYIIQSWFLQFCIRCSFKCSWKIYYSLLLIVLANISQWAHYFAEIYQNSGGNSRNCATSKSCYPNIIYERIKPFAHPLQMEYFLLSMILIAELWPTNQNHGHALPSSNHTTRHGNENTPLLSSLNHLLPVTASMEASIEIRNLRGRQPLSRLLNSKAVTCVAFGVAIVVPCYIFGSITLSERVANAERENVTNATMSTMEITDVAYDIFLSLLVITLLIISFYLFSNSSSLRAIMVLQVNYYRTALFNVVICQSTMETLAKLFNAAVIMPFTAGEPNENNYRNNNIRPHDGRISGFILVSSVFVIVLLSMLGVEFVDHKTIGERTLYDWLMKSGNGIPEKPNQRSSNHLNPDGNASAKEFFELLPKMPSHYCRANRKEKARAEKASDKIRAQTSNDIKVVTLDLQAVLLCPLLKASALYYKTKLGCHNFTVHEMDSTHVTCYFWTESEGELTANSFASCLSDFIDKLEGVKELVIYSDGCTYQNRNLTVSNTLLRQAFEKKITIIQKYLEKGHTQMECDSIHSTIERKLRNKPIYCPQNYIDLIKDARPHQPYDVKYLSHEFFGKYSELKYYSSIRPGNRVGDPVVTNIRVLKYTEDGSIQYKLNFSDQYQDLPRRSKVGLPSVDDTIERLYLSQVPIKKAKYQHLQELKAVIPRDFHPFYDSLPHN